MGLKVRAQREFEHNPLALHEACKNNDIEKVRQLVVLPEKINIHDSTDGRTPLIWAAIRDNIQIARILLDAGAQIDSADKKNTTPLHWAAMGGDVPLCTLLLDNNACIEARDDQGLTSLHWAASALPVYNRVPALKALLFYRHAIADSWQAQQENTGKILSLKNICLYHLASRKLDKKLLNIIPVELQQEIDALRHLLYMKYLLSILSACDRTARDFAATWIPSDKLPALNFIDNVLNATTIEDLKSLGYEA